MPRLLVVSNRLPVTVRLDEAGVRLEPSSGGLATGLAGPHEGGDGLWIGWPGLPEDLPAAEKHELEARLVEQRLVPVPLGAEQVQRYYEGYANGVLWPLFHYLLGQLPLEISDWDTYEEVNEHFAEAVASVYRPGDEIWVHDYQLLRVPALLRRRLPGAMIGFFLHIPFPSSEVFRTLPQRHLLLEGLLGADLIGFHTVSYLRHFATSALRILGIAADVDRLSWQGREVRLGVFPMGIDAAAFAAEAGRPEIGAQAAALRQDEGVRLMVGIDRLDYTKGIPRRLLAFERLLERNPELRERVRLIQVAVPSREEVEAYQTFRSQAEALIGRIQGAFATPRWVPIHWLYRTLSREEILALYRAADVMLVTPVRDGMNLVAKEFVASRTDEDGVLVLSEFAGAASELAEAVFENPFDIEGSADAFLRALDMPEDERRTRMRSLRRRVLRNDVHRWVRSFRAALAACAEGATRRRELVPTPPAELEKLLESLSGAERVVLLLDYDGTLVPFASTPELARPDGDLLDLLRDLAGLPGTTTHVVSGRTRETLERWLGALPLHLHAEHGLWSRAPGQAEWSGGVAGALAWRERAQAILEDFAANTPGSLVEEKSAGLAWHWRASDPQLGARQARELQLHLTELLANSPVEILPGSRVIELRPQGVNKGQVVERALRGMRPSALVLALGDDRTDEDLFAALPPGAIAIHVGARTSRAAFRIAGVGEARAFLRRLVKTRA